jgi:hypothetical protein
LRDTGGALRRHGVGIVGLSGRRLHGADPDEPTDSVTKRRAIICHRDSFALKKAAMASRYGYSRALRTLGQALEKHGIDLFDLQCDHDEFYLQCGEPTPPYLSLVELHYSVGDLNDLDLDARAQRGNTFRLVNFAGLPEILRAVGRRLEEKEGQLVHICKSEPALTDGYIQVEYQTRDGRRHIEELFTAALGDHAMRMYKERLRGPELRGWK